MVKILRTPNICWICDNNFIYGDDKVTNCCQITKKYKGLLYKDFNIKVKLSFYCTPQPKELGQFDFNIKFITDGIEEYSSLNINNNFI